VKALVATLIETISRLEDRVSHLEEHLNQNSQNSSRPPSKDGFGAPKGTEKGKGGGKRGAQPGHPGYSQKLYPPDACQGIVEHRPETCAHCGETTRSPLPLSVHPGGYGERLSPVLALLSGTYRQSHQQVKTCLAALFGIEMSTGSINRLRREVS
jgi:hypothetical protein